MKKKIFPLVVLVTFSSLAFGQNGQTRYIGNTVDFSRQINNVSTTTGKHSLFILPAPDGNNIAGKVNLKTRVNGILRIAGKGTEKGSSFHFNVNADGNIDGLYTCIEGRKAYKYNTDQASKSVLVKEVAIESVLCVDFDEVQGNSVLQKGSASAAKNPVPILESNPGAQYVIYIDLDGEVSTSNWNGGVTINAAPYNYTTGEMQTIWEVVAQDYIIFNVNVTTNRTLFDTTALTKKMMCIVTPTNTAAPGSGGVAYENSFGTTDPCWCFNVNSGTHLAGSTVSHEIGHTVGLYHDGTSTQAYYGGHNGWSPIMGSGIYSIDQWSIGEYRDANNHENDINKIAAKFGFKPDDVGNTIGTAHPLVIETDGSVLDIQNRGLINNRTDIDIFSFATTITGNIKLTVSPFYSYPNLNVKARLLNSSGAQIAADDPAIPMSATVIANSMPPGTYYLEVDGVGDGANAIVGYSDYGSVGDYYITGKLPMATAIPVAGFSKNALRLCDATLVTYTDTSLYGATSWNWAFPGGNPSSSTIPDPIITYTSSGPYTIKLVVQNSFGTDSIVRTDTIQVNQSPAIPVATGNTRCDTGIVNLMASGSGGVLEWYDAPTGGTLVDTGTTYSPYLDTSTTYYVRETGIPAIHHVGPPDSTISFGFYYTNTVDNTRGMYFDVYSPCTLKSVAVYSKIAGIRTIEVQQGIGGTTLNTKTVNITAGKGRVILDFDLQPGTDYYITVTGTLINLFVNLGGTTYPYTLPGLISITQALNSNQVYYFYDWEIAEPVCYSNGAPVTGTINQSPPVPTITQNGDTLISSSPSGNQWYFNGAFIPGATGQNYIVTVNGSYNLSVTIDSCTSAQSDTINFTTVGISQTDKDHSLEIYPNPNDGIFNIKYTSSSKGNYRMELRNALGQLIYRETLTGFSGSYSKQFNISECGHGIYMVRLIPFSNGSNYQTIKKVIVY